jgi:hypothetical protein
MVAPFVSCVVPTLWFEALPLLSAAASDAQISRRQPAAIGCHQLRQRPLSGEHADLISIPAAS